MPAKAGDPFRFSLRQHENSGMGHIGDRQIDLRDHPIVAAHFEAVNPVAGKSVVVAGFAENAIVEEGHRYTGVM